MQSYEDRTMDHEEPYFRIVGMGGIPRSYTVCQPHWASTVFTNAYAMFAEVEQDTFSALRSVEVIGVMS